MQHVDLARAAVGKTEGRAFCDFWRVQGLDRLELTKQHSLCSHYYLQATERNILGVVPQGREKERCRLKRACRVIFWGLAFFLLGNVFAWYSYVPWYVPPVKNTTSTLQPGCRAE